jgi:deuterolysin
MISTFLPIAAFAGLVAASCPLSVEISGTAAHVANVSITNTADEAITVFKGNTVLSEHATKDLVVFDSSMSNPSYRSNCFSESRLIGFTGGNALPFEGVFVNYKRSGLATELFRTLQPGETVTASVNAAKSYKLAGIETAEVTAVQGFKYVTGAVAPASLKDTTFCQSSSSGTVTITPDQSTVAR